MSRGGVSCARLLGSLEVHKLKTEASAILS